ncbi:MAG: threonyl-tRNA synthetase, partial [Acidimicrobiia bacterium]|nr:threonyl-tRNA synthetase [Acidimicrobiia bacterium]
MGQITVTLPDGSSRTLPEDATGNDLAQSIGPRLARAAVIVEVNGVERDLVDPLPDGATVSVVTAESERGLYTIRHSTTHVMAQAVLDLWPGATFAIGPPVENGFYYDFELPGGATFSAEDLPRIEARMREIIAEGQPFVRRECPVKEGLQIFSAHRYKREIIEGTVDDPTSVTERGLVRLYENPPRFVDLCRGPHVPRTDTFLGHFKLMRVAGAYWRGQVDQPMLQRIYGTAWATKKDLDDHLHMLEEAEKRDHRRLAHELDLVSWPQELGPGLAVWHPKGATVRQVMEDYSRARHSTGGYQMAYSPHIARSLLWETSGHLGFYADSMDPPMELDEGIKYYPQPMNCPFPILIYRSQQRSYRELPQRFFELGTVY